MHSINRRGVSAGLLLDRKKKIDLKNRPLMTVYLGT